MVDRGSGSAQGCAASGLGESGESPMATGEVPDDLKSARKMIVLLRRRNLQLRMAFARIEDALRRIRDE